MTFTLSIECDNAAFHDEAGTDSTDALAQSTGAEVARILREAADAIEAGSSGLRLRDYNGNPVGRCDFDQE